MKYEFFVITMLVGNKHKVYLGADSTNDKRMIWTTKDESVWFESEKDAKDFAEHYFKNFKNYNIENLCYKNIPQRNLV